MFLSRNQVCWPYWLTDCDVTKYTEQTFLKGVVTQCCTTRQKCPHWGHPHTALIHYSHKVPLTVNYPTTQQLNVSEPRVIFGKFCKRQNSLFISLSSLLQALIRFRVIPKRVESKNPYDMHPLTLSNMNLTS